MNAKGEVGRRSRWRCDKHRGARRSEASLGRAMLDWDVGKGVGEGGWTVKGIGSGISGVAQGMMTGTRQSGWGDDVKFG